MHHQKIAKRLHRRGSVVLRGPASPWKRARLQLPSAPRSPRSDATVLDGLDEDDGPNGDEVATICNSPTASEAETQMNGPSDIEETKTMAPITLKEDHHGRTNNKMSIEAAQRWKERKRRKNKKDKERRKRRINEAKQALQKAMAE